MGPGRACRDPPLDSTLLVLHAYGLAQPWVLLTDTPVAETEPTLYACRNWIEQGFRGLKTVGDPLGGKWHKTRRLDPTRVGRHWLVLAIATLLAVAYGTRPEEAAARHLPPGRLRRPPAGDPLGVDAAQQAALPPRRHSRLQQGVARLRLLLQAAVGLRVAATYGPVPTSARACAGWTPAAPEPTRALGAGPSSHSSIALSTPRLPRSSAPRGPPHRPGRPHGGLSALKTPVTGAPPAPGPATHGAGPPIRTHPPIPAQKIPL